LGNSATRANVFLRIVQAVFARDFDNLDIPLEDFGTRKGAVALSETCKVGLEGGELLGELVWFDEF